PPGRRKLPYGYRRLLYETAGGRGPAAADQRPDPDAPCGRSHHEPGKPGGVLIPPQMVQSLSEIPVFRTAGHGGRLDPGGNIVILVDNSPACMILPSSVFDIIEEADDYYFPPVTGTYLRLSRMTVSLLTLLLTPIWLLLMQNPDWIPGWLTFIQLSDEIHVPLIWQLLILEFAIDGLRLAAVNTPSMLTTPLSVIAGIVLGEYSVKSGWFNSETMLYMAFVTVANYSQASYELGYALKFMRVILLLLTSLFNFWGFAAGLLFSVCAIVFNRTIAGKSYIYPLIPFSWNECKKRFLRGR